MIKLLKNFLNIKILFILTIFLLDIKCDEMSFNEHFFNKNQKTSNNNNEDNNKNIDTQKNINYQIPEVCETIQHQDKIKEKIKSIINAISEFSEYLDMIKKNYDYNITQITEDNNVDINNLFSILNSKVKANKESICNIKDLKIKVNAFESEITKDLNYLRNQVDQRISCTEGRKKESFIKFYNSKFNDPNNDSEKVTNQIKELLKSAKELEMKIKNCNYKNIFKNIPLEKNNFEEYVSTLSENSEVNINQYIPFYLYFASKKSQIKHILKKFFTFKQQ
jgi:hypothetical protein